MGRMCLLLAFMLLSSTWASSSSSSMMLFDRKATSDHVIEFFFRQIKPGMSVNDFNNARQEIIELLCDEETILECEEWQKILKIEASLQLRRESEKDVYISMFQYESEDSINKIMGYMMTTAELPNLMELIDNLCTSVTRGVKGFKIDQANSPYPDSINKAKIVNIKPHQLSQFDANLTAVAVRDNGKKKILTLFQ